MASIRDLKKTMQLISSEMITDVFFRSLVSDKNIEEEADQLVIEISQFAREFISRIGKNGGKDPKEVKAYYRQLYADWDEGAEALLEKIDKL